MTVILRLDFRRCLRPLVLLPALSLGLGLPLAAPAAALAAPRAVRADIAISGRVVDEKGAGLPGVNVIVRGTNIGTQTDVDGRYSITAADSATLVFTFVGYAAQEVAIGGRTSINAALAPDARDLEEIVVAGYGVQGKKLLATSISSIPAKQVELVPVASPSEALVGLVAGAQITEPSGEPGAGAVIRIRGLGSISAGNNPLYIVDGYPLNSADNYNQIPPGDIQSIQILKDAAACAIYGSRGDNGIVKLTAATSNRFLAEMKFIRALAYFNAVRIWGDVPLVTGEIATIADAYAIGRSPAVAVYAQVEKDLTDVTDVLLMYAEAVNEASGPTAPALEALNKVIRRSRNLPVATPNAPADLPAGTTAATLRLRTELERRLELNFEGHRWFDLVRTDRAIPVMNFYFTQYSIRANGATTGPIVQIDQHNLLFPLPIQELQTNPILTQNPGYN